MPDIQSRASAQYQTMESLQSQIPVTTITPQYVLEHINQYKRESNAFISAHQQCTQRSLHALRQLRESDSLRTPLAAVSRTREAPAQTRSIATKQKDETRNHAIVAERVIRFKPGAMRSDDGTSFYADFQNQKSFQADKHTYIGPLVHNAFLPQSTWCVRHGGPGAHRPTRFCTVIPQPWMQRIDPSLFPKCWEK